jgi:hypothetical protein
MSALVQHLCCSAWVEALRRADPPSKDTYQMSKTRARNPEKWEALNRIGLSCYTKSIKCERALFPNVLGQRWSAVVILH